MHISFTTRPDSCMLANLLANKYLQQSCLLKVEVEKLNIILLKPVMFKTFYSRKIKSLVSVKHFNLHSFLLLLLLTVSKELDFLLEDLSHDKSKEHIWKPFLIYCLGSLLDQTSSEQIAVSKITAQ